ncbi:hypothetical protein [Nannocystis radixulma]|uniref:Uncharacterized protein n=1 Tax=Nannocystis radixulma TaxID=2995305 RepID=A0ABT5BFB6_9BACT|nr:hypothetical protein [Nannocystis radixulma]MDC0672408.1 hypothetical protein [Nannocystis radixulma]
MPSGLAPGELLEDRHRIITAALSGARDRGAAATPLSPLIMMAQAGRPTPPPSDKWSEIILGGEPSVPPKAPPAPPVPPPTPTGQRRPPWLIAVLALLGLGVVVLGVRMASPDGDERAEPPPAESAASESADSSPAGETPPADSKAREPGVGEPGAGEPGAGEPEAAESGSEKSGSEKSGSEKSGSEKSGSEQSGSEQSGSEKSGSEKSGSGQSESGKSGSEQSGSEKSESGQSGSGKSESANTSTAKSESAGTREADRQKQSSGEAEPAAQKTSEKAPADKGSSESSPAGEQGPPPAMPDPPTEPEHLFRPHRDAIAKQCKNPRGLGNALVALRITIEETRVARAEANISSEDSARQAAANCIETYLRTKVKVPTTYTGSRNFSYAF